VQFAGGLIEGPIGHDVINLITYVGGGYYDYDAMQALRILLTPGQTFLDVGANIGPYSVFAGNLVGTQGRIIAIEPSERQLAFLRRNLARLPAPSTICPIAVADTPRSLSFVEQGHTMQHLAESDRSYASRIRTSTLDVELARIGCNTTGSFAKIDVEGWDAAVILGAGEWLSSRPQGLLVEANDLSSRSSTPWAEAVKLINVHGFKFVWPEFAKGVLHSFDDPQPVSPFGNYLIVRPDDLGRLELALKTVHSAALPSDLRA
jgi:FkbM family methyltransferase